MCVSVGPGAAAHAARMAAFMTAAILDVQQNVEQSPFAGLLQQGALLQTEVLRLSGPLNAALDAACLADARRASSIWSWAWHVSLVRCEG